MVPGIGQGQAQVAQIFTKSRLTSQNAFFSIVMKDQNAKITPTASQPKQF